MSRVQRQWNVRPSALARNTHNPIREIIEEMDLKPNPNKSFIPLSVGFFSTFDANWLILQRNSRSHRIIQHIQKSTSVVQFNASAAVDTPPTQPPSIEETRTYFFGKNATYNYDRTSLGDPTSFGNLKPPEQLLDAVRESLCLNESRSYSPCTGDYRAKKAVMEYSKCPAGVTTDDVIIGSGCAHTIDIVISTLAEAGQNIIVPRPGYGIHKTLGEGLGIIIKYYDLMPQDKWKVDLKSLENQIDENTVAIVVNNPSNPCGSVYSKQHLLEIVDVASRNHLPIIADEIYEYFVFKNEEFVPISSLSGHVPVFTCSGLSKRFLVPGWRLGWVIVQDRNRLLGKDIRKGMYNMASRFLGANTLMQQALPKILKCATLDYFNEMMLFIENQARTACRELEKAPGLRPIMPQGSMYMMVEIKMSLFPYANELQFINELCREQSVLCIPSKCFNYQGFMRLVLTVPEDILLEACSRIIVFTNKHVNEANGISVAPKMAALVV